MLEGYTPVPLEHFGGLVTAWPPEMLDASLMAEAVNVRFTLAEICSREGLALAFATPSGAGIAGLLDYVQLNGASMPLVLDQAGNLFVENPAGSGTLTGVPPSSGLSLPAAATLNGAVTFNRAYLACGSANVGIGAPSSFDGVHLDPVTIAPPADASTAADAVTAGNVAAGVRYGVVLYRTRAGSLTAAGPPFTWTAAGGLQATVSALPLGPPQVAARIVAFTVAGGSSAGPYFWIEDSQTVNGVSETSTVVNDNTTVAATFNFDDAFLASSSDATDQFRAIELPFQAGVVFSETTQRLLWWGDPDQPSVVQCSQPNDAGVYWGDTGFFEVASDNGQRITAVFEFRNQIYVAKQDSLYLVTPNNGDPATWSVQQVSAVTGICAARAVQVSDGMALFVHRTGAYIFDGGVPTLVSDELLTAATGQPGLWERINWACDYRIWAHLDHENKCVRIGIPLDGATACSHILKVSYLDGWDRDIRFSPFTGRFHFFPGRRWSLDTIAAGHGTRLHRPVTLPKTPPDRRLQQSQVMLGSSGDDGGVYFPDPASLTDNGVPFRWSFRCGGISAAEIVRQQRQGMEMLGLVQVRASGMGRVHVDAVVDGGPPLPLLELDLCGADIADFSGLSLTQGENIGLRFSNPGNAAALRLQSVYAFVRPTWRLRPGA